VSEGRLYWIADGYTTTNEYPYSQPARTKYGWVNYIRNPVKAVIDAYEGDITLYVIEEEPIIQTYSKIFPGMFKDFSEMSSDLKHHVRYPEDLFSVQADVYSTYHMTDPRVFYTREDVWVIPDEKYRGGTQQIQPYYVIIELPGQDEEEFVLMAPFVPKGKDNLIGWMAAGSDGENYGKRLVYLFSKQELIFGPMQIEARIDQDTEISAKFTLWGQAGSRVLRGNTLVIPIEESLLYIEPIFLEATEQGTQPQLKQVIVAYGDRLTMQQTLGEALLVIFGDTIIEPPPGGGTPEEILKQVEILWEKAQRALIEDNDLGEYQQYVDMIGILVNDL